MDFDAEFYVINDYPIFGMQNPKDKGRPCGEKTKRAKQALI
jgi:hypothetical protein